MHSQKMADHMNISIAPSDPFTTSIQASVEVGLFNTQERLLWDAAMKLAVFLGGVSVAEHKILELIDNAEIASIEVADTPKRAC